MQNLGVFIKEENPNFNLEKSDKNLNTNSNINLALNLNLNEDKNIKLEENNLNINLHNNIEDLKFISNLEKQHKILINNKNIDKIKNNKYANSNDDSNVDGKNII